MKTYHVNGNLFVIVLGEKTQSNRPGGKNTMGGCDSSTHATTVDNHIPLLSRLPVESNGYCQLVIR